jgi:hypothetical protein
MVQASTAVYNEHRYIFPSTLVEIVSVVVHIYIRTRLLRDEHELRLGSLSGIYDADILEYKRGCRIVTISIAL